MALRRAGAQALALPADLSSRDAAATAVLRTATEFGGVDVLVNNAVWARYGALSEVDEPTLDRMLGSSLKATYWTTQAALPWLVRSQQSAIVNVSSVSGSTGIAYASAYAMVKAALDGLTRAWSVELGAYGIRVNSWRLAIPTDMSRALLGPQDWERRRAATPLGRLGTEEDVVASTLFLASRDAAFVTGEVLHVDGGFCVGGVIPGRDVPRREAPALPPSTRS